MWRDLIFEKNAEAVFQTGADDHAIALAEDDLGIAFPADLRSLLRETDGVMGIYGPHYIWSVATILHQNLAMQNDAWYQSEHKSFTDLLFFSEAGVDGLLFAYHLCHDQSTLPTICCWNPLEDTRIEVAKSLQDYLTRWLDGTLAV